MQKITLSGWHNKTNSCKTYLYQGHLLISSFKINYMADTGIQKGRCLSIQSHIQETLSTFMYSITTVHIHSVGVTHKQIWEPCLFVVLKWQCRQGTQIKYLWHKICNTTSLLRITCCHTDCNSLKMDHYTITTNYHCIISDLKVQFKMWPIITDDRYI